MDYQYRFNDKSSFAGSFHSLRVGVQRCNICKEDSNNDTNMPELMTLSTIVKSVGYLSFRPSCLKYCQSASKKYTVYLQIGDSHQQVPRYLG